MKSNKEYIREDIYSNIESLLNNTTIDNFLDINDFTIQDNKTLTISETEEIIPGKIDLHMDAMKSNLYMLLVAPINTISNITIDSIKKIIDNFGETCKEFVNWELVEDIYNRVFNEGEIVPPTIIAKGRPVEYQIPMYIKLKESLNIDLTPKIFESGKVDFHKINSFIMVKKGEYIADIIPEQPGKPGMNLMGQIINPPIKVISYITDSINTVSRGHRVFSAMDGCLKKIGRSIIIENCLDIESDVDYNTGDIEFDGDIHICHTVREGFSLKSRDDIFIDKNLEPTNVICGANLYVQQGIWGDSKYSIQCSGLITSKHINNVYIKSKGTVYAENSIIQSTISTLDKIVLDRNGSIIGGKYHALNGIKTGNIGNENGIITYILLGVDYKAKEKLEIIQRNSGQIIVEMDRLQVCLHNAESRKERDKIKYLYNTLKNRLHSFSNYSRTLLSNLDKNDSCKLTVFGKIYPGTFIDICHVSEKIDKIYENIEFSLDKEKGRIKWEYL